MKVGIGPLSLGPNSLFLILFMVKQLPGNLASATQICTLSTVLLLLEMITIKGNKLQMIVPFVIKIFCSWPYYERDKCHGKTYNWWVDHDTILNCFNGLISKMTSHFVRLKNLNMYNTSCHPWKYRSWQIDWLWFF